MLSVVALEPQSRQSSVQLWWAGIQKRFGPAWSEAKAVFASILDWPCALDKRLCCERRDVVLDQKCTSYCLQSRLALLQAALLR